MQLSRSNGAREDQFDPEPDTTAAHAEDSAVGPRRSAMPCASQPYRHYGIPILVTAGATN